MSRSRTSGSSEYPQDPADAGANLSESERTEAVLAVAKMQRSEVLDALRRIELGTYGTCVDCGAGVPEGRLEARPEAARCVSARPNGTGCGAERQTGTGCGASADGGLAGMKPRRSVLQRLCP